MPYLDGLPTASSVSLADYVAVAQGGTTDRPGTATVRKATLEQIFEGVGIAELFASPPPIGSTTPNTGAFTTLDITGLASMSGGIVQAKTSAWSGATYPGSGNVGFYGTQSYTGAPQAGYSDTFSGNDVVMNLSSITSDQLDMSTHLDSNGLGTGWNFNYRYGGGSASGPRVGMTIDMSMTGAMTATSAFQGHVALNIGMSQTANWAGAASGAGNGKGYLGAMAVYSGNIQSGIYAYSLVGCEWISEPKTGSEASYHYMHKIVNSAPVGWHGLINEAAISFASVPGAWNYGIFFGDLESPGSGPGISTTGTAIYANAGTMATAVDFSASTLTGSLLKGPGGLNITGAGNIVTYSGGVNAIQIAGNGSGSSPNLQVSGANTNVGIDILMQAAGGFRVFAYNNSVAKEQFGTVAVAGSDGYPLVSPGIAASAPVQLYLGGTANNLLIGGTLGTGVVATNVASNLPLVPRMAGTPTGTVVNSALGAAIVGDTTASKIWMNFDGTWKGVLAAASGADPYLPSGGGTVTGATTFNSTVSMAGSANTVTAVGNSTGNSPVIRTSGSDSNVGLDLTTQGSGSIRFFGNNSGSAIQLFSMLPIGSADGYPRVLPGLSGSTPVQIQTAGTANNLLLGGGFQTGSLATNATTGFAMITFSAGAPTGTVVNNTLGCALHYDTTNNQIYVNNAGTWKKTVALT